MTKAQFNNKLQKLKDLLDELAEAKYEIIDDLENKIIDIEDKASERNSGENTEKELERIDAMNNTIDALNEMDFEITSDFEELE